MREQFNPYRDWLGLQLARPPANHYELLGLAVGESDARAIAVARDRALARLRAVPPGERTDDWERIVRRVRRAAQCLLDADRRAAYDAELKTASTLSAATAKPVAAGTAAPLAKPLPMANPSGARHAPPALRAGGRRRKKTVLPQLILSVVLLVAIGVAGVFLWLVLQDQGVLNAGAGRVRSPSAEEPAAAEPPQPEATTADTRGTPVEEPIEPAGQAALVPSTAASDWNLTPERQQALGDILEALGEKQLDRADDLLAEWTASAESPGDREVAGTLKNLVTLNRFYWQGVGRGLRSLQTGQVIPYRDREAIVVEQANGELVLRAAGQDIEVPVDTPPRWLVEVAVERGFNLDEPANWLTLGARELVDPDGDRAAARDYWERAASAGEPGEHLLPLLDWAR